MPRLSIKSRRFWITATVVMLAAAALMPARYCVYGPPMKNIVIRTLWPLATPMHALVGRMWQRLERPSLGREHMLSEKIRRQDGRILQLEQQVRWLQRTVAELQGLRRRLGDSYRFLLATVIGRASDPAAGTMTINLGARDGLRIGMAVVEGAHLIGRIVQVSHTTSAMEPLISKGNLVEVVFAPPILSKHGLPTDRMRTSQLVAGSGGLLYSDEVDHDMLVEVGDYARLRDVRGPNAWPAEAQYMLVGQVTSVSPNPDAPLRKRVEVRSVLSLYHVDTVTVIVPRHADGHPQEAN